MTVSEKQALSKVVGSESTTPSPSLSTEGHPVGLDTSAEMESGVPSVSPAIPPSGARPSLATIVELGVRVMGECLEVAEAMKEEMSALVAPADPSLVDMIDFECVLCTG